MANEPNPGKDELEEAQAEALELERILGQNFLAMSQDEEACLSAALFPDSFVSEVEFLGEKRELRALPIKWAKMVFAKTRPVAQKAANILQSMSEGTPSTAAAKASKQVSMDEDIIQALFESALVLAEFYGWGEEVVQRLKEEDATLPELQTLCIHQQALQGASDFLLHPLRTCIRLMQVQETLIVKFQGLLATKSSARSGDAV